MRVYLWLAERDEVRQVDGADPFGIRINDERANCQRNAVRNAALLGMQLEQPGLTGQRIWQRPLPELKQEQGKGTPEQRSVDEIVQQVTKAEPECGGGGYLGIPASDPSKCKTDKSHRKHGRAGRKVHKDVGYLHPACKRQHEESCRQCQRNAIGNRHGEEVARCRERHQRREEQQTNDVENHEISWPALAEGTRITAREVTADR